ncbi:MULTISPECIES: UxaA family hydrolase [unclassified Rhizobium]|jgi:hypothetical protein|uniref:UxaA family hydrolase n=1 Tax=unclassified Rhizobium TaxID=2613769 RepID=UPI000648C987|nr:MULTISPECIES: UxaA family hydrolase [unclassified Rhizobium]OJY63820.1 MAG: hypothetical protein BGP09_01005 [Rhizobium sp. 60-20]RKD60813.1 SAF domain-containing protein [Rhizobium sp. WW_1]
MGSGVPLSHADDPRLLLLAEKDNVLVCREDIAGGERIYVGGREITLARTIPRGHKIARRDIAQGDKVYKYGAPIGSAVAPITPGDHVHVHNVKSDYTPSHFFDIQEVAKK